MERSENEETPKKSEEKGSLIAEEDLKMIKENHKKIADLDKALKLFISGSHLETMKQEIHDSLSCEKNSDENGMSTIDIVEQKIEI